MLEINVFSRTLKAIGKVTRTEPLSHSYRNRIGLEFIELEKADKEYLADYVTTQQA
jgi:hypothetical protein